MVDANAVTRGLQGPNPVSPAGAMVRCSLVSVCSDCIEHNCHTRSGLRETTVKAERPTGELFQGGGGTMEAGAGQHWRKGLRPVTCFVGATERSDSLAGYQRFEKGKDRQTVEWKSMLFN